MIKLVRVYFLLPCSSKLIQVTFKKCQNQRQRETTIYQMAHISFSKVIQLTLALN